MNLHNTDPWSVEIAMAGRDGSILYAEHSGNIHFYCEFGGGDVLAIIHGLDQVAWEKQYPWAMQRRMQILQRVAQDVIRQKAPACIADVDERSGHILLREPK